MTFESALSFFLAILIFGITPGPGVFAILARSLVHGVGSCWALFFGMALSDVLYLIAACLGLAAIATNWAELFTVIRVAGAIYLVYLGWKMWKTPLDLEGEAAQGGKASAALTFFQGFVISASNPKVILFYIAFLPTFLDVTVLNSADIALVSGLTLLGLMIGVMSLAFFASKARLWFRSEKAMKRLNRSAGSIMVGAGMFLLTRG